MKQEYQDALDNILDTFTGADGGAKFLYVKILITNMSIKVANGDKAAKEVLDVLINFSRLIDIAEKVQKK
jgi:hypothetical protein